MDITIPNMREGMLADGDHDVFHHRGMPASAVSFSTSIGITPWNRDTFFGEESRKRT
jgi:hypothetical protein